MDTLCLDTWTLGGGLVWAGPLGMAGGSGSVNVEVLELPFSTEEGHASKVLVYSPAHVYYA